MFTNDGSHVVCVAVTYFDGIFVEELMEFMVFGKVLVLMSLRKVLPMLVFTFSL